MRNAFSMITAIFIIVLLATVAVFILNISAKTVKDTVFQYKREQAILYARSYTEAAIMKASASASGTTITGSIDDYNITATITPVDVNTSFILVDVLVSYPDDDLGGSASPVTYHKRTLQKL
jgi:hypothetical protein